MKTLSWKEIHRRAARNDLRRAAEIRDDVQRYLHLHEYSPKEVAEHFGMPQTLVRRLNTDNLGYLHDCVEWMRKNGQTEIGPGAKIG